MSVWFVNSEKPLTKQGRLRLKQEIESSTPQSDLNIIFKQVNDLVEENQLGWLGHLL